MAVSTPGTNRMVARPALLNRLAAPSQVITVSAPPGSGKTMLLRSWADQADLEGRIAWVSAEPGRRDQQRFWPSVLQQLRRTVPGAALIRSLTAAPGLDGWTLVERLLKDLTLLRDRLVLVVDDMHELGGDALQQLELLVLRAPSELRFVLSSRLDMRPGLHRLRLTGDLAEIRADDLRFSVAEARDLFASAGVEISESAVVMLNERTEGWAAGLRLAALSLTGRSDPERLAAEFFGGERTVAGYLLDEVLDRQTARVRRLLLRTSVLSRVNGELADLLTGDSGGERVLQDLEDANAFVTSTDASRSWFRYHQLFSELLARELRRTAPDEVAGLHRAACRWLEEHGHPIEAVRHAQAAHDWNTAAGLLADNFPGLYLDGRSAETHELLVGFPPGVRAADARLAAIAAADELAYGSVDEAERRLRRAADRAAPPADASAAGQTRLLENIVRLLTSRQLGDQLAVAEQARRLVATAESPHPARPGLHRDLRALALISLGDTAVWAGRFQEAASNLGQGIEVAREAQRPFLEFTGLAQLAMVEIFSSFLRAGELAKQAIDMAEKHGWDDTPTSGTAYIVYGAVLTWQGRPEDSEYWIQRAERTVKAGTAPATMLVIRHARGALELARGREREAVGSFRAAERSAEQLAGPHLMLRRTRALMLQTQIRLGEFEAVEKRFADFDDDERDCAEMRITTAVLRLAQHDPSAATVALAPVLDGSAPTVWPAWLTQADLLEAIARDALGDQEAAHEAVERALDRAEPGGALLWFLLHPVPELLERHSRRGTAHAGLIAEIRSVLYAKYLSARPEGPEPLSEPLSGSELRVLRYLPTNLTASEIAAEMYISGNTVKTHISNLYAKLGAHRRSEAVARARGLGLLAPSRH